ncbi:hypothetical protein Moror_15169 [Moniliophthora roreri MCA 2997]|uniref:Uncharacterized protein n=1 Tax=Moniliophthora roreri (strain MCA 2997) TaxID=1381753 RepID=V2WIV5_MONRO|nr:hypothetical protein Moror_15169 [Moniliophthora roreri MCA 2997]
MSAATRTTPSFLRGMQGIYPPSSSSKLWKNPWYILASVAFSAANEPEGVPIVFHLMTLDSVMPEELKEREVLRDTSKSIAAHAASGKAFFEELYGNTAIEVQGLLDRVYPNFGYGLTYSFYLSLQNQQVLTALETSYTLLAALISKSIGI